MEEALSRNIWRMSLTPEETAFIRGQHDMLERITRLEEELEQLKQFRKENADVVK